MSQASNLSFISSTTGQIVIAATNASVSTGTGALLVAGGVGVGGSIFAGGVITATNMFIGPWPVSTGTTGGGGSASTFTGGIVTSATTFQSTVTFLSTVTVSSGAVSTSTATGALIVRGGVGIGGNLVIGGSTTTYIPLYVATATIGVTMARFFATNGTNNNVVDIYAGSGSTSYIGDQGARNAFGFNSSGNWLDIWTNNAEVVRVDSSGNILVGSFTSPSGSAGMIIAGTSTSLSSTQGALQVAGGVGVVGNIYTAGRVGFVNTSNVSAVYQYYNTSTNSFDTVFG